MKIDAGKLLLINIIKLRTYFLLFSPDLDNIRQNYCRSIAGVLKKAKLKSYLVYGPLLNFSRLFLHFPIKRG
jgi:hypothetical protein